jgi:hypothetical protein
MTGGNQQGPAPKPALRPHAVTDEFAQTIRCCALSVPSSVQVVS